MKFISQDYTTRPEHPETPREIKDDMVWPVVNSFFEENGLFRHQLESCNESYLSTFKDIIANSSPKLMVKNIRVNSENWFLKDRFIKKIPTRFAPSRLLNVSIEILLIRVICS